MAKIISISNQKVGVVKTTTAINLSASLAALGKRILLVDADPQSNATTGLNFTKEQAGVCLYECLVDGVEPRSAILQTEIANLHLLPARIDLVGAELELISVPQREYVMRKMLAPIQNDYDYIFIDCLPSLGLLVLNSLTAANTVLIPIQCEFFALDGVALLISTIQRVQKGTNPALDLEGFLLTMYQKNVKHSMEVADDVRSHFEKLTFNTIIYRNIHLSEAASFGKPALLYEARSSGAANYMELAKEFLSRNTPKTK